MKFLFIFKYNFVLIYLLNILCIYFLFLYFFNITNESNFKILVFIFSCNRDFFLNNTLLSLYDHFHKYERNISFTLIFSDSGTINREYFVGKYNINNVIFMNPSKDNYVYNIAFSMLYMKYVLFMEDDRPFIKNIENKIIYSNFIEEGLVILEISKSVYGITFKPDIPSDIKTSKIKTILGNHILCIIHKPYGDYYYVNGPTLYKTEYLKLLKNYVNEHLSALFFKNQNLFYGFTYKNLSCSKDLFSVKCQSVSLHLDYERKYSTNKKNQCNNYLY